MAAPHRIISVIERGDSVALRNMHRKSERTKKWKKERAAQLKVKWKRIQAEKDAEEEVLDVLCAKDSARRREQLPWVLRSDDLLSDF